MRLIRLSSAVAALSLAGALIGCGGGGGGSEPSVGPPAAVQAASGGSSGSVAAGSTTPLSLVAKVADASGRAVSGVTVTWSAQSGSITPGSSTTDGSGQASALWTPGKTAGTQTASASVTGAGSATFTATVTAGALAKLKLTPDTVKLSKAGDTARVTATGADAFDNPVAGAAPAFTIDDPKVATVSATGLVTAGALGTTTVRATSGPATGSAIVLVASTTCGAVQDLAVGGASTLVGPAAAQLCIKGSAGAEFVAMSFYSPTTGGSLALTFDPAETTVASGPPTPTIIAGTRLRPTMMVGGRELTRNTQWEESFRERTNRELGVRLGGVRGMRQRSDGLRKNISFAVQAVDDLIDLNVNADSACSAPVIRTGRVVAVSNNAIVVNDTSNPPGFSSADFDFFARTFDSLVVPVDTTNFGAPSDIDSNGNRVILLFTKAVNALTPQGAPNGFVGGFFYARDLFPKTAADPKQACASSNFAEMFYLLTPDPAGAVNSNVFTTSQVRSLTIGTIAHEFEHLINASRRVISTVNFTSFEAPFLDEGLAHIAEELTFYRASGLAPRSNIDVGTLASSVKISDAANSYQVQNQRRFRNYLRAPESNSLYGADNLATRGATWSFLRYAVDLLNGNDASRWRQLVNPTTDIRGIENLKAVFGSSVVTSMRDWAVADYADDALTGALELRFTHPSWHTRSIETFVNGTGGAPGTTFPLKTIPMPGGTKLPVTLIDGGAAYLRFGVGAGITAVTTVTAGTAPLPNTFSVTIVRTR